MTKSKLMEIITTSAEQALSECHSGYSLEIWTRIENKIDSNVRRAIGDENEAAGRNRYTGRFMPSAALIEQESRCTDGNT